MGATMKNLNSLLIEGTLIQDTQLQHIENGISVCNFSIQSVHFFQSNSGVKNESSIFDVQAWGTLGESCHNIGHKGRVCRIVGRLKQEQWHDQDGNRQSKTIIFAEHIEFKPEFTKEQRLMCDRCGKDIEDDWYFGKGPVSAGNCTECGDNLCKDCAVSWDEDGRCKSCQENDRKEE